MSRPRWGTHAYKTYSGSAVPVPVLFGWWYQWDEGGLGSRHSFIPGALAGARERWGATRPPRLFFVVVAGVAGGRADVALFRLLPIERHMQGAGKRANIPARRRRPSCHSVRERLGSSLLAVSHVICSCSRNYQSRLSQDHLAQKEHGISGIIRVLRRHISGPESITTQSSKVY